MGLTINPDLHPDYPQRFKDAVRHLFPILGFTLQQMEAFIHEFEPRSDGKSHVIEHGQGLWTFYRYSEHPRVIELEYVIPSDWDERYALVKEALLQLKNEFLSAEPKRSLFIE